MLPAVWQHPTTAADVSSATGSTSARAGTPALVALADDIPAPILAQILGIHIHTAERWAQLACANRTTYLETRINS